MIRRGFTANKGKVAATFLRTLSKLEKRKKE